MLVCAAWGADAFPALAQLDLSLNPGLIGTLPSWGSATGLQSLAFLNLQNCSLTGVRKLLLIHQCRSSFFSESVFCDGSKEQSMPSKQCIATLLHNGNCMLNDRMDMYLVLSSSPFNMRATSGQLAETWGALASLSVIGLDNNKLTGKMCP